MDANIPDVLPLEPPKTEIYSNLPPRTEFIGREKEKVFVTEALNSRWPLVCIDGIGGIGKTSLALEVVHEYLRLSKNKLIPERESKTNLPKLFQYAR